MKDSKNQNFVKKLKNAVVGLKTVLFQEMNIQIHFLLFFVIIYFANFFKVTEIEWCILILTFALMLCLEMVNTLAEELCDLYSVDKNLHIKKIKDIAAGAVLLASLSSLIIWIIIFLPYLHLTEY